MNTIERAAALCDGTGGVILPDAVRVPGRAGR
jgi:hypothetical protein